MRGREDAPGLRRQAVVGDDGKVELQMAFRVSVQACYVDAIRSQIIGVLLELDKIVESRLAVTLTPNAEVASLLHH